jgi:hypothetical protein
MQNQTGNYPSRWDKTGTIVEIGPGPRQYHVRADGPGRVTMRNRKFLRKCHTVADQPYPYTTAPTTFDIAQAWNDTSVAGSPKAQYSTTHQVPLLEPNSDSATQRTVPPVVPNAGSASQPSASTQQVPYVQTEVSAHPRTPSAATTDVSPSPVSTRRSSRTTRVPDRYGNSVNTAQNIPERIGDDEIIWRYHNIPPE